MPDAVAVSILIPAWDEAEAIGAVVAGALAACRSGGLAAECLVCVDGRTGDATAPLARAAGARTLAQQGRGLTAAVLQAAASASGDVCVVLDGDGQHDAGEVPRLAGPVLAGEADLVLGNRDPRSLRRAFGAGPRGALRHCGARLLGSLARLLVRRRVPDPLTGMFACRRADLLALRNRSRLAPPTGYKLLLGLLVQAPAHSTLHETVAFEPRRGGASKLDGRVLLTTLRQLLAVSLVRRAVAEGADGGARAADSRPASSTGADRARK